MWSIETNLEPVVVKYEYSRGGDNELGVRDGSHRDHRVVNTKCWKEGFMKTQGGEGHPER